MQFQLFYWHNVIIIPYTYVKYLATLVVRDSRCTTYKTQDFNKSEDITMDYTCRTKTLQSLARAIEKESIVLSHKLQRPEGQWSRRQKSDLIDSLLRKYPINPTYGIKEGEKIAIIDGVQRLSCVRDFLSNKFALSNNIEPVVINGEERILAGLKFNKLDEDTKDIILNAELQVYELTDCTEKDVREMFRRQNAGKPLNAKQLRIVNESDDFSESVYILATHPFMNKLMTKTQRKNGTDRDLIIQAIMLIENMEEDQNISFRSKNINLFVAQHQDTVEADIVTTLNATMDKLNDAFEKVKIPLTSIPMILYCGYKIAKDDKPLDSFVDIIVDFLEGYDNNEEYKKFVQSATSDSENVQGRFNYWVELIEGI